MKTFMVGGSIRDKLMHRPVEDYDWLVVGSSHDEMIENGFTQVGADFPVYLHPDNNQEYALARIEKKTGKGYLGFDTIYDSGNLNPELLEKFTNLGYDPEKEYDIQELLKVFKSLK
jgi:tRNA nucleotidyltransferase (CCA-adding enzyme)